MTKNMRYLSILLFGLAISRSAPGGVVLSEIMFNAPENDSYEEYIELYNASATLWVDLQNYTLGDADDQDALVQMGQGFLLAPESYALVLDEGYGSHSTIYDSVLFANGQDALILTIDDAAFGASGLRNSPPASVITLCDSSGNVAAVYAYTCDNPNGISEEKLRLDGPDAPDNWANSLGYLGTPGYANSVQPLEVDLAVVAIMAAPSPLPFGSELALTTRLANMGLQSLSGGELTLFRQSLDNSGGGEALASADFGQISPGDTAEIALQIESMPPGPQQIWACHNLPDLRPENDSLSIILLGGYPAQSLILNEFMAHPGGSSGEWVELHNAQESPVNLRGMFFSDEDTTDRTALVDTSIIIEPGGMALLAQDSSIFQWPLSAGLPVIVYGSDWMTLTDNGDRPTLWDAAAQCLDAVPYYGWEMPEGISWERLSSAGASEDPANWRPSQDASGGTPGQPNSYQTPQQPPPPNGRLSFSPDPFDPDRQGTLQIQIQLPANTSAVGVMIFDLRGRRLKVIFDDAIPTGEQMIYWDGSDSEGRRLPPGLYILFVEFRDAGGDRKSTVKQTLVIAGKL